MKAYKIAYFSFISYFDIIRRFDYFDILSITEIKHYFDYKLPAKIFYWYYISTTAAAQSTRHTASQRHSICGGNWRARPQKIGGILFGFSSLFCRRRFPRTHAFTYYYLIRKW